MGILKIFRPHNDCGCNSPMEIIITDVTGNPNIRKVADNETATIDLPQGLYNVYVKFGIQSNTVCIPMNEKTVKLTACVISQKFKPIIHRVILR